MDYRILTDEDVYRLLDMPAVIGIIEEDLRQKARGNLVHPPRIIVEAGRGALVFTAGASPAQDRGLGFRVYSRFKQASEKAKQLVAVFDSETGAFRGAVIGTAVGELRTGAIGGAAVRALSRTDSRLLGILGTGHQAVTQVQAAAAVRNFERALVFSRDPAGRSAFAQRMGAELGLDIQPVDTARAAVEPADVVLCCTNSPTPVLDPAWIAPGAHVTTIGPKLKGGHEFPVEGTAVMDLIATDSLAQIESYGDRHFLHGHLPLDRFVDLGRIVAGDHPGRPSKEARTLFCSEGLAGTEVALAAAVLSKMEGV